MAQLMGQLAKLNFAEFSFLETKRLVALDIGDTVIHLVELEFTDSKPTIVGFGIEPLPDTLKAGQEKEEQQEQLAVFIQECLRKHNVESKHVSVLISGGSVFSRKIRIPKLPTKELENGIRWEAANQIPFSLENSYFDYQFLREVELPDGTMNNEYMIAASSKKPVDNLLGVITKLGLRPCCIGIPIFALYNLIQQSSQFDTNETVCVVDIGPRRTNIIIVEQKTIMFSREIPIGDDHFNEALMHEIQAEQWDVDLLHKIKQEKNVVYLCFHGAPALDDLTTKRLVGVIRPLLEKLFNEIRRSFDYFKEHFGRTNVKKIILSGKGVLVAGMNENFKKVFELPVEYLQVDEIFVARETVNVAQLNEHILDFAILLGLAAGREKQINFVPTEYKEHKTRLTQVLITGALSIVSLFVVLLLILFVNIRIGFLHKDVKTADTQMGDIVPQIQLFNERSLLYKTDKEYLGSLRKRQLLLANALKELSNIIPRSVTFQEVQLDDDGWVDIIGVVFDDTLAELSSESVLTDFIIAIENSPFFSEVKLVSSERGNEFEVPHNSFKLTCKVVSRKNIKEL